MPTALNKFDPNYLANFELVPQDCPYQIQMEGNGNECISYELTMTFNPQLWTLADSWCKLQQVKQQVLQWLKPYPWIDIIHIVTEKTKRGMPHLHINITMFDTGEYLDLEPRRQITQAIQRVYGRCSFRQVADYDKWIMYLEKELYENYTNGVPNVLEIYKNFKYNPMRYLWDDEQQTHLKLAYKKNDKIYMMEY